MAMKSNPINMYIYKVFLLQPFSYSNWGSGEPNNAGEGEDCIHLSQGNQWNDLNCERNLTFICQKPQG